MRKFTALKITNMLLSVFFANQALSAIFHEYYSMKAFRLFHMASGYIFLSLLALHILLNLNWFKTSFSHKKH